MQQADTQKHGQMQITAHLNPENAEKS